MKYLVSLALGAMILVPFAAQADVIPDGEHYVENCFTLDNADQFPEYSIYLTGEGRGGNYAYLVGEDGGCSNGSNGSLIAVKTENVDNIISGANQGCPECTDNWAELPENQALIIPSNLNLEFSRTLPDVIPTVRTIQVAHIDRITDNGMEAHLVSAVAQDDKGKTTAMDVSIDQGVDVEAMIMAIVFIGLGVIGLALAAKTWKK